MQASTTTTRPKKTAVLYLRMSDERQERSIPEQRSELLKYAEKHGYRVLREYADSAISGDDTARRVAFLRSARGRRRAGFAWFYAGIVAEVTGTAPRQEYCPDTLLVMLYDRGRLVGHRT